MDKWIVIERRYRFEGTSLFFAVKVTKETDKRWYYLPPDPESNWRGDTERYITKDSNRVSPAFPSSVAAQQRVSDLEETYGDVVEKLQEELDSINERMSMIKTSRTMDLRAPH